LSPRTKDLIVVAAQAGTYGLAIGIYSQSFERFVLPLLPALACIGAYGVRSAVETLARWVLLARPTKIALGASLPMLASVPWVPSPASETRRNNGIGAGLRPSLVK